MNSGETPLERSDRPAQTVREAQPARVEGLWEEVFSRENLYRALQRVESRKGAPGVDGMTVVELRPWLKDHWVGVRGALDAGTYKPQPVRRVTIPKPGGGKRELGVPTVLDRLIQQALAQALTPIFDPHFSERSYGYRPSRSAQQAVRMARGYVTAGEDWVVDIDLDRFLASSTHYPSCSLR
ncbi:MAG TPA: reverse transcriptase domain-containing protein [Gemmatimonadales bacterium]|nr:reverse transcriptase domain-containing protein [Gemmatimonadales bacterium]